MTPMNYLHNFYLVEAEKARVLGQLLEAEELYEKAIAGAAEHEFIQDEALAYELAAKHYLARGREKFAQTYMKEAHSCYERWGAAEKVKALETCYPQFFVQSSRAAASSENTFDHSAIATLAQQVAERTAALQKSEAKFRAIFENSQVGIFRNRLSDGLILNANQCLADLLGFDSPEEIIGLEHSIDYFVNPSDRQQAHELMKRDGELRSFEAQLRKRDGTVFWGLLSSYLNVADGYVEGVMADISDRKQAEEALQRSEAKFRAIFENSQVGIFRVRFSDGLLLDANQRHANLFGFDSIEEIVGLEYVAGYYADLSDNQHLIELLQRDREVRSFEAQMRKRDGTLFWGLFSLYLNADDDYMEGVIADISDLKRAEASLQKSEERLRLALTASNQGLYDLNIKTEEIVVNPEYALILGYDPATYHVTKSEWMESLHPDDRESVVAVYDACITGEVPNFQVEYRRRTQDDQWKWILDVGKIVAWNESGEPIRALGVYRVIDDRKRAEEASILEERNRMAREIHDTLAQTFTGILAQVGAANQVLADDLEATQAHLDLIKELARTGLVEARRSVVALRPQLLEEGSLQSALYRLVTQTRAAANDTTLYWAPRKTLKKVVKGKESIERKTKSS
jgi:PAS domain S-box-containing protein